MNSEALVTRADDLGYRVTDQQLLTEMSRIPQLQVDGKWDLAHALAMLKAQGRPIAQIEDMIRHDAKLRQLDSAISASSFVTPDRAHPAARPHSPAARDRLAHHSGGQAARPMRRPTMRRSRPITTRTNRNT